MAPTGFRNKNANKLLLPSPSYVREPTYGYRTDCIYIVAIIIYIVTAFMFIFVAILTYTGGHNSNVYGSYKHMQIACAYWF